MGIGITKYLPGNRQANLAYDFKAVNDTDFVLTFTVKKQDLPPKVWNRVFPLVKRSYKLKSGYDVTKHDLEDIPDGTEVPEKALKLAYTFLKGFINSVKNQVLEDSIVIIREMIDKAYFTKDGNGEWMIIIIVKGQYTR